MLRKIVVLTGHRSLIAKKSYFLNEWVLKLEYDLDEIVDSKYFTIGLFCVTPRRLIEQEQFFTV